MILYAGLEGWGVTEKPEAKLRSPLGDAKNLGSICPAEIFKTGPALTFSVLRCRSRRLAAETARKLVSGADSPFALEGIRPYNKSKADGRYVFHFANCPLKTLVSQQVS